MSLWAFVCSVLLCTLWEKEHLRNSLGRFFSHRAHRVHWAFLRTVRVHRRPSAYRGHRALLLMKIPIRRQKAAYIQPIGVSRWSLPFPSGEGSGEGPLSFWHPVCSVLLCSLWEKICHSLFVIMSFCLKKHTCLLLSLCHYVLKKIPVSPHAVCSPV